MKFRCWLFGITLILTSTLYASSYSSGSKSKSSSYSSGSRSSYSSSKPSSSYSSSKSSYSSSKSSSSASPSSAMKPSKSFFSNKADSSQAKMESKTKYETYKATKYESKYKASPQSYNYLRNQPKETYTTRQERQKTVFNHYYNVPQPQYRYSDTSWNPWFWMWLMDRPNHQAAWVYNHRSEISDERYKDLLAKNKDLEKQIKELEDKKIQKDPNYVPTGVDKDLMYSDEYVKDVQKEVDKSDYSWLSWLFGTLGVFGFGYIIYAIFFKERDL